MVACYTTGSDSTVWREREEGGGGREGERGEREKEREGGERG